MNVQNPRKRKGMGIRSESVGWTERGATIVELAFILPILLILAFGIVDFGRLIHARLVVANVSREGGSLASRDIPIDAGIINMLLSSATPLDLRNQDGRIYVTKIKAGERKSDPEPYILSKATGGALSVPSVISGNIGDRPSGLSPTLYAHLRFQEANNAADILDVTVVEVFYEYRLITPLPKFITDLLIPGDQGLLIGSRSYF
jgi:hypothetical protein